MQVLYSHPKIAEAAVIGIKDPIYGEDIKAFVTLKAGQAASPDEIRKIVGDLDDAVVKSQEPEADER